jgi:UDP-N-acetylglucosamine:LPS N-acetylglucosamine transferase
MTYLIVVLSSGKGTWGHVAQLIAKQNWDKIFLITNEFGKENFEVKEKPIEFIVIDSNKYLSEMVKDIKTNLEGKIKDAEVALNFISGTGKEHMATLSAILKLGLGVRLVTLTPRGIEEI